MREGRWQEAVDAVEELRNRGGVPSQRVSGALVKALLRSQQVSQAADVSDDRLSHVWYACLCCFAQGKRTVVTETKKSNKRLFHSVSSEYLCMLLIDGFW